MMQFEIGQRVRRKEAYPSGWKPEGTVRKVTPARVVVLIENRAEFAYGQAYLTFKADSLEAVYHTGMDQDQKDAIVQAASSAAASLNALQGKVPVSDTKNTTALAAAYKAIADCQAEYQG
jgi:hypothetical protein